MTALLKTKLPLVSLVIPAFNHSAYLPEAIRSVLAQDYPHLELFVIDDGSTDNTAEVLSRLGTGFYWESQKNMGQSRALTRGWSLANGDIFGYLSADDLLLPCAVSTSVAALLSMPDTVATYCNFNLIDPQSRRIRTVKLPQFSYENMLLHVSCPIGPGAFFRRSAYLKSGPWNPNYQLMPDYDFWLRLGLQGGIFHLQEVLAGFRIHDGSNSYSTTSPERAGEPILIVSNLFNECHPKTPDLALKKHALASAFLVSAQLHLRAKRFSSAFLSIRHSMKLSKRNFFSIRTFRLIINGLINRIGHRILWNMRSLFGA